MRFQGFCGLKAGQSFDQSQAVDLYRYFVDKASAGDTAQGKDSPEAWKKIGEELILTLRLKYRSLSTEKTFLGWVRDFYRFLKGRHPAELDSSHVKDYLSHLAVELKVSAATQSQAFNAILFLYRNVLNEEILDLNEAIRAKRVRGLPVVLTKQEVLRLLHRMEGTVRLIAELTHGCVLRVSEWVRLRVKDIDFEGSYLTVRAGKGDKDRVPVLPESLKNRLREHLDSVREIYERDRSGVTDGVFLPEALSRKNPTRARSGSGTGFSLPEGPLH